MTDLFSVCIRFNGGNHQMFKVRYINVTLKGLSRINWMKSTKDSTPETQGEDQLKIFSTVWFWQKNVIRKGMHLPTTTIVLPLKLDKFKLAKQQFSSIHLEVLLFLSKQHVSCRISYICFDIEFLHIR
ncbi:hypothetical protein MTR_6g057780 [Medicago truncatula]|uniref:Uncharacterized protein n=1 Tax=Medicago truncatula TaxID=3880 RepID=G7KMF6_MEDTR|nr:hypothetical protein MTR_6g057780 [Medicago truncatula]